LAKHVGDRPAPGTFGISHTRWATHGGATDHNAHPHFDTFDSIAVVHNGVIENYRSLKQKLIADGVEFRSETDTEVLAHLIANYYQGDLLAAVRQALYDDLDTPVALAAVDAWCATDGADADAPALVTQVVDALLGVAL
jgi:glucosamine 6-phosphate synthetase-like amidotransferase/phosphosugar isomerase protein